MHKYRTHNCNELQISDVRKEVKLSGWVHRRRDHGNLVFIDLRDHYGITQIVFTDQNQQLMEDASRLRYESVITVRGTIVARSNDTINDTLPTGHIEVLAGEFIVESAADTLPFVINTEKMLQKRRGLNIAF